jgi:hypothetical protein
MANLSDEERRALKSLAGHSDGCDEAALLADGFTIRHLAGLVIDGFATGSVARVALDGREKPVVWMKTPRKDGRRLRTEQGSEPSQGPPNEAASATLGNRNGGFADWAPKYPVQPFSTRRRHCEPHFDAAF